MGGEGADPHVHTPSLSRSLRNSESTEGRSKLLKVWMDVEVPQVNEKRPGNKVKEFSSVAVVESYGCRRRLPLSRGDHWFQALNETARVKP